MLAFAAPGPLPLSPSAILPFQSHILPQPLPAAFSSEARLPEAAEAGCRIEEVGAVDPDGAGFQLGRDIQSAIDVLGPHAGRQTVGRVIGESDCFCRRPEGHADQHWTEY